MSICHKCLIIDDEPLARNILSHFVEEDPRLLLAGSVSDAFQAMDKLREEKVAIIFLDINLPVLDGLQFLKLLENPPQVIFTTAYPQYAVESYEMEAADYLVKPFAAERFEKAVTKAIDKISKAVSTDLVVDNRSASATTHLFLKVDKKLIRVGVNDIHYVEAIGDYLKVHTDKENYTVYERMQVMAEMLPVKSFIRVHRSYIISMEKIDFIEGNFIKIQGKEIPIGSTFRDNFFKRIKENGKPG